LAKNSGFDYNADIIPAKYELGQNYPNPFNPVTHISFGLPKDGDVSLKVFNTQGQMVGELLNGFRSAGTYEVVFDASSLASGLYFYHLQAGSFYQVKRMLLIK
jgi:Secretion system C-terminal sorting domain